MGSMTRVGAKAVRAWASPEGAAVALDDVKALRQAVSNEIEAIGCGFFQRRTVTILGFGNVADAVEILAIGYILTVYEETEGALSPWESSFLTAAVFAGMVGGGLLGGLLGDAYGRRPVLLTTLAINASAAFLSALSPSVGWLILFRAMAGVGVGGVVSSLSALCLEHVPVDVRGRYVTILCSFWMVGSVMTAGTAWIMLGKNANGERILDISWRWFAAIVGLPSFTCCVFSLWYIPESAHFLASRGDAEGASRVLQQMHDANNTGRRVHFELAANSTETEVESEMEDGGSVSSSDRLRPLSPNSPPVQLQQDTNKQQRQPLRKASLSVQPSPSQARENLMCSRERLRIVGRLFRRPQLRSTALLMMTGFCLSFGSYGLSTWITKLFQSVGMSNPFANAFLFAGANLPGNVVSLYLIDVVGHRQLFSGALFSSAASALLFAFNVEGSATIVVLVSCLFNACTTSAWNGFGVLSAENFPLELRTTGISVVNCSNRLGAICAQFVNGFLVGPPPHVEALLLVVSSVMAIGGVASRYMANHGASRSDGSESPPLPESDLNQVQRGKTKNGPMTEIEMKKLEEADLRRELEADEEEDHSTNLENDETKPRLNVLTTPTIGRGQHRLHG